MAVEDWVPFASVISSAAVALGGVIATWNSGRQQRQHEAKMARNDRNQLRMEKVYGELVEWADSLRFRIDLIDSAIDVGPDDDPYFNLHGAVEGSVSGESRPAGTSRMYWSFPATEAEAELDRNVTELRTVARERWSELVAGQREQTSVADKLSDQIRRCTALHEDLTIQVKRDLQVPDS